MSFWCILVPIRFFLIEEKCKLAINFALLYYFMQQKKVINFISLWSYFCRKHAIVWRKRQVICTLLVQYSGRVKRSNDFFNCDNCLIVEITINNSVSLTYFHKIQLMMQTCEKFEPTLSLNVSGITDILTLNFICTKHQLPA